MTVGTLFCYCSPSPLNRAWHKAGAQETHVGFREMRLQSWSGRNAWSLGPFHWVHNATTSELFHSTHLLLPLLSVTRLTTVPKINDWICSNHAEFQFLKPNMLPFSFKPSSVSSVFGITPQLHPSSTLHGLTFHDRNQGTLSAAGPPCPSCHRHPNNSGQWLIDRAQLSLSGLDCLLMGHTESAYEGNWQWANYSPSCSWVFPALAYLTSWTAVKNQADAKCSTNVGYKSIPPVDCGVSEVEHND